MVSTFCLNGPHVATELLVKVSIFGFLVVEKFKAVDYNNNLLELLFAVFASSHFLN
ncbi:hypothetical protein D3C84_1151450 [compost metagenome]